MKFQLIQTDEYNQSSILASADNVAALIKKAKAEAQTMNVENALTAEEKLKNWESYLPLVLDENGKEVENIVFGGRDTTGKFVFYDVANDATKMTPVETASKGKIVLFLGNISKDKTWYATNERKQLLSDVNSNDLKGKTFLSIKVIR